MPYTEFFVTGGAAASDLNGGGPRLGTNDGPVYTTTNATVSAGTPTIITDGSGSNWTGVQVDDFLLWDTAGVKELRRVTALAPGGVAADIQVHANCTAGSGKAVRVGGAWATLNFALSKLTPTMRNAAGHGVRLNMKNDVVHTGDATTAVSATHDAPITIEGYTSAPGDGGEAELRLSLTIDSNHNFYILRNLYINRAAAAGSNHALLNRGSKGLIENCRATAPSGYYSFYDYSTAFFNLYVGCTAVSGARGFYVGSGHMCRLYSCVALSGVGVGFMSEVSAAYVGCVAAGCFGAGFTVSTYVMLDRCLAVDCGGHGFDYTASAGTHPAFVNCVAFGNSGYGFRSGTATATPVLRGCAAGGNTSGATLNIDANCLGDLIALPGDPFVRRALRDYRLNLNSPAAALLLERGFPAQLLDRPTFATVGPYSPRALRGTVRR